VSLVLRGTHEPSTFHTKMDIFSLLLTDLLDCVTMIREPGGGDFNWSNAVIVPADGNRREE